MRITILILAAAVLLSLVLDADAATRFEQLQQMHQVGPVVMPAQVSTEADYVCYWRLDPNEPIMLSMQASATQVRRLEADSVILNRLVEGSRAPLIPTRLPIINGPLLGGRSVPLNMLSGIERHGLGHDFFFGLGVHAPSGRRMATILKIRPEEDLASTCRNSETLEYLCIASEPET